MALHTSLRPIGLARSTGISVQQVRNYESWGLLPPASRSKSGYRLYTQHHLAALKAARSLIGGYGRQRTGAIMQALHQGDLSAALALIDTRHGELASKRHQMEQALSALHALAAQPAPVQRPASSAMCMSFAGSFFEHFLARLSAPLLFSYVTSLRADNEFYQATSVISRRRRIYARIADLSANSPSMRFPGR